MSTDYGEKERQFLETLKADTGRDLNEWMAAIADAKLASRNDIIDWLRQQGFMFSKASWLERIHNNGGRPLYEGGGAKRRAARARPAAPSAPGKPADTSTLPQSAAAMPASAGRRRPFGGLPPSSTLPPTAVAQPPSTGAADLEHVLAKAKAFRPLANFVLGEIAKAVPEVRLTPYSSFVLMSGAKAPFAVLIISAKDLRLGLPHAGLPMPAPFAAAKLPSVPGSIAAHFTHVAILTDARQINDALIAKVRETARILN